MNELCRLIKFRNRNSILLIAMITIGGIAILVSSFLFNLALLLLFAIYALLMFVLVQEFYQDIIINKQIETLSCEDPIKGLEYVQKEIKDLEDSLSIDNIRKANRGAVQILKRKLRVYKRYEAILLSPITQTKTTS